MAMAELIQSFLDAAPGLLHDLQQAVAEQDARLLRMAAHTLKSSAKDFGAARLAMVCQELEDCGRSGQLTGAAERLRRLEVEYGSVCAALECEMAACRADIEPLGVA